MLSNLRQYLGVLRGLAAVPRDAFLASPDQLGNAKYHFVIAVECCIDIANHIIASEGYRFPKDNADSFVVLIERSILEPGLRDALRAMARFGNRLVHLYWDVDDERVYEFLQEALGDIERFGNAIARREW
jgi:uncharacterized protein YutE (UPF0331/DUF86 family)